MCQRVALDGPAKPPRQRILVEMDIEVDDVLEPGRMSFDRYAGRNIAECERTVMAVLFRHSGLSDRECAGAMQLDQHKQPMLSGDVVTVSALFTGDRPEINDDTVPDTPSQLFQHMEALDQALHPGPSATVPRGFKR